MRCSSKVVDKAAPQVAVRQWWTAPDPGSGIAIELGSSNAGDIRNVVVVSERLTGKRLAAEDPPPAFNEVQPRRADGNKRMLDARMRGCAASHSRIGPLLWLARLSATR